MTTVAIVGGGFSGTMVAVQLLRQSREPELRILLIDCAAQPCRGTAYSSTDAAHLLNVPASGMSAFADEPEHFVVFCRNIDPALDANSFVPRWIYGEYLDSILRAAQARAPGVLSVMRDRVEDIVRRPTGGAAVRLCSGAVVQAEHVVLAPGHHPGSAPQPGTMFDRLPMYVHDPWSGQVLDRLANHESVLLLGTGLTAVDMVLSLTHGSPQRQIFMLSRHGLLPRPFGTSPAASQRLQFAIAPAVGALRLRELLRTFRRRSRQYAESAADWRLVMQEIRPQLPALWERLDDAERRRFLRHVAPHWEVHRHRLAPLAAARLAQLTAQGRVTVLAGRIREALYLGSVARVTVQKRGAGRQVLDVGRIVNCTGPCHDLAHTADPLLRRLLLAGAIKSDPLRLGLALGAGYRLLDASGRLSSTLRYIGPLLKARYWEATAVPELRAHAAQLAGHVLAELETGGRGLTLRTGG